MGPWTSLRTFAAWIYVAFMSAMQGAYRWLVESVGWLFTESLQTVLTQLSSYLPADYTPTVTQIQQYCGVIEGWFPLNYAFVLLLAWLQFTLAFMMIKIVIKLIPGMG